MVTEIRYEVDQFGDISKIGLPSQGNISLVVIVPFLNKEILLQQLYMKSYMLWVLEYYGNKDDYEFLSIRK